MWFYLTVAEDVFYFIWFKNYKYNHKHNKVLAHSSLNEQINQTKVTSLILVTGYVFIIFTFNFSYQNYYLHPLQQLICSY